MVALTSRTITHVVKGVSMDIDWNDEPEEQAASSEHEEQASAAHEEHEPAAATTATARKVAIDHRGFYMTYISALAAVLFVAAVAGVGFVFGHYVVKPNTPVIQSPAYAKTNLPGNGSGGFQFPDFGGGSSGGAAPSFGSQTPSSSTTNDPG